MQEDPKASRSLSKAHYYDKDSAHSIHHRCTIMKDLLAPLFLLLSLLSGPASLVVVVRAQEVDTCACTAKANGFTINCGNQGAMTTALSRLAANNCFTTCTSAVCRVNYFIIQAHHDYVRTSRCVDQGCLFVYVLVCWFVIELTSIIPLSLYTGTSYLPLPTNYDTHTHTLRHHITTIQCLDSELPSTIEDGIHLYEAACQDCEINRKYDSSLPNCPTANCNNGSGNAAYLQMVNQNCGSAAVSCGTTACQNNFRILKAVHDNCDEESLSLQAELGLHDLEEVCGPLCNSGSAADDAGQLICSDGGGSTGGCPEGSFVFLGACACFAGTTTVETRDQGRVALQDVSVGDYVKVSADGRYEPIYGYAHYNPQAIVPSYVQITTTASSSSTSTTTTNARQLQVSSNHLLQLQDGTFRPAGAIPVGAVFANGVVVTATQDGIRSTGIYAPYTPSGTIMVDGVPASCYVVQDLHNVFGWTWTGHWLAHAFEFPHRVACFYFDFGKSVCETYNADGIHVWKETPMRLVATFLSSQDRPLWLRNLVLSLGILVLLSFVAVEFLVFQYPALSVVMALGARAVLRTRIFGQTKRNVKHV
jgi:Hint module